MHSPFPSVHRLLFLVALITIPSQLPAQIGGLLGLGEGLPFANPSYTAQPSTIGRANLANQLNTEGSDRRLRLFPITFAIGSPLDPPDQRNLYFSGTNGETATYTAEVLPAITDLNAFLTQLNNQGARGYRFYGPEVTTPPDFSDPANIIPPVMSNVYVKTSTTTSTYTYEATSQASSANQFLQLVNARGAEGWQWLASLAPVNPSNGATPTFYEFFLRASGPTRTFSYRVEATLTNELAALSQMNLNGESGYRWLGPFSFGTYPDVVFVQLYQKDNLDNRLYSYHTDTTTSSIGALLTQANTQGSLRRTYFGSYSFNGSSTPLFRNIYIGQTNSSTPPSTTSVIGCIAITPQGRVTFLIQSTFARFQLYTSTDLRIWSMLGPPQSGAPGTTLSWETGLPLDGRRFFRVGGIIR